MCKKDKGIKPLGSSCSIHPLLSLCRFCGNIWISNTAIRCPFCNFGNIHLISMPLNNHPKFTFKWLNRHGFPFIRECLEVETIVKQ